MMGCDLREGLGRIALVLFGLLLILIGELTLRWGGYGEAYNFVIQDSKIHKGKSSLNSQYVALHYFKHLPVNFSSLMREKPWFQDTEFFTEKKQGVFRIFTLGASTTRGFPFTGREINYSRFLEMILKDVVPGKNFEVINAGYDALSSFGVLDLTREVINYEPDLLIIYSGHNEFIGHFGVNSTINYGNQRWIMDLVRNLHHSRLFLAGELMVMKVKGVGKEDANRKSQVNMFRAMLSKSNITWDQTEHSIALKNYQENLNRIVTLARNEGIQVMLLSPASNIRDFPPIRSIPDKGLSGMETSRMKKLVEEGRESIKLKQTALAFNKLKAAVKLDSGFAESHFLLGKLLEAQGNKVEARKEYRLAREFDGVHLRACAGMQAVVRKVGKNKGIAVVDLESKMEKVASDGIVGDNFFLEHVHPNINGHFLIADSIAHALELERGTGLDGFWDWSRLRRPVEYVRQIGYGPRQFVEARYTVGRLLLDFPFYHCDSGEKILRRIDRLNAENNLLKTCWQIKPH
ncbi:MAG: hypothetical protein G3M70_16280 [Candidatus Nitronauta litoralis]|uniref:SGNH hydrolase-type esterase domain-containing protein n=1 Tax=Candidatus Nitronauta litoralis TaxID=2705533 RepID=A0A7T0G196_9BACT|nr:MAG: hypothetical protein G3M70_16280 [Candidatus Nitronauta litoralis]